MKMRGIVFFLCFLTLVSFAEETTADVPEKILLEEARAARESAEKRVVALNEELAKLRQDYATLRTSYAELFLRSSKQLERLKELELRAANLVQDHPATDAEKAMTRAVETLSLVLARQVVVQDVLADYEKYLATLMDVLRPSAALRSELTERTAALKEAVEKSLQPLAQYARGEQSASGPTSCTVLSVSKEKELVFLDCGLAAGVRPGRRWCLCDETGKAVVRLVTVDCRGEFSAAVPVQGDKERIGVGSLLTIEPADSPR